MSENAGGTTPILGRSKAAMLIALKDTSGYQSVYQCQWSVKGFNEADADTYVQLKEENRGPAASELRVAQETNHVLAHKGVDG